MFVLLYFLTGIIFIFLIFIIKAIFSKSQKKSTSNFDINLLPIKILPFKSSNDAFEYIKEYFTLKPLEINSAFYGLVFAVFSNSSFLVEIFCLINKKRTSVLVFCIKDRDCKSDIIKNDLVYLGVDKIGSYFGDELFKPTNRKTTADEYFGKWKEMSIGTIFKKAKLDFNIKTGNFDWF